LFVDVELADRHC